VFINQHAFFVGINGMKNSNKELDSTLPTSRPSALMDVILFRFSSSSMWPWRSKAGIISLRKGASLLAAIQFAADQASFIPGLLLHNI
jgi:hypothetical protein